MAKGGLTYEGLLDQIARNQIGPLYLFFGPEDFLISEATEKIIARVLSDEQRSFNLDVLYGSDVDAQHVVSVALSYPVTAERRVVVVREFDKLSGRELLGKYAESPPATTVLVLISAKTDFRKKPFSTLQKKAILVEFPALRESELFGWVMKRVKSQGRTIDPDACRLFASHVGDALREAQHELDKVYLYAGDRSTITVDDVSAVVGVTRDFNVFELQRAIGGRNVARATEILHRMLEAGESPTVIIIMLTRYFAALWKLTDARRRRASEGQLASEAGVHPRFVQEYLNALDVFGLADVERAFTILAATDEQLKSTTADPVLLMQVMVVNLMKQHEAAAA